MSDEVEKRLGAVEDDIDTLKHAVFGFGDGESGMLSEVRGIRTEFSRFRAEMRSEFANFRNALLGAVVGVPAMVGAVVVVLERLFS